MKSDTLVRDAAFYKRFFSIWSMLVLYNIITLGVNLADNVMIGAYSEIAMSGVSAVNQIQFVFQQLMMGVGDGIVVLGSQYWGKRRPDAIRKFLPGAFLVGAGISLFLFVAACVAPEAILAIFTPDPAIRAAGVEYLRIIKYSYLIFALSQILLAMLRSVETVRIGFWVSLAALAVNISLNYLLIGGHLGAPALGATGAAIATGAARTMELAVVLIFALRADKKLGWRIADIFRPDRALMKDFLRLIRPMLFTSLMFGVAVALQTAILGHMNENAIAANSVASTLFQTLKVASVGAASAAVGRWIGSRHIPERCSSCFSESGCVPVCFCSPCVTPSCRCMICRRKPIIWQSSSFWCCASPASAPPMKCPPSSDLSAAAEMPGSSFGMTLSTSG